MMKCFHLFFSPWYKQIPPSRWGSARQEGNSPQGPFCPNQCLCSWWPQRCRGEEKVSLSGGGRGEDDWMTDCVLTNDLIWLDHILVRMLCAHWRKIMIHCHILKQWINKQLGDLHSGSSGLRGSCLPLCVASTASVAWAARNWSPSASGSLGSQPLTCWASLLPSGEAALLLPVISSYWSAGTPEGSVQGENDA